MASTRSTIDLVIRGSLSGLTGAVGAAKAELDALRQRTEAIEGTGTRAARALGLLGKAMLGISAASGTIHLIAGATVALGQLAGSAVLIPAALAGLGAVFATVKIGMKGFFDALKPGAAGSKAFANLSANAKATVIALKELGPAAHEVKNAVQDSLFKGLSTEVAALGRTYLPLLKTGLAGIATPLNGLVTGFVRVAKSGQSVKDVNTVLGGTKTALTGIEPAAGAVLAGFLRLASAGIKSFAGLGKGITDVAIKFRDWANDLVVSGRFDVLVARAKEAFGQIASIVGNVGATIASIFRGLSTGGGSPLAALDALTTKLREFFATASAQDALKSLGEAFRTVADVTRSVLLEALKQLAPIVRDLAPFVAECARVFGDLLVNALKIVGPILQSVAKFLGEHKELAQVLIPLIAGLALKLGLLKVGTAVITGLGNLSRALGGLRGLGLVTLAAGIAAVAVELDKLNVAAAPNGDTEQSGGLADTLHNIVEAGKQLAEGDFSGIMAKIRDEINQTSATWTAGQAPIQQWFDKIKTSFSNDLLAPMEAFGARVNEIIGGVIQAMTDFGTMVNGAIDGVIAKMNEFGAFVNGIIAGVIQAMTDFGTNVNAAIQTVIDKMNEFGAFVNGIIAQVIAAMTNFGAGVNAAIDNAIQAFVRFVTEVANNVNQAIAFIGTLPGRAAAALASLGALIVGVANQAFSAFLGAIRSGADAAVNFVRGIPGMISGALGNLGSILVNAGRSLMDGLLSGIRAGLEAVLSFARTIAAQIAAVKGPIPKDRKTLVPAGLALMHGLLDGLKTGNRDVQAFVGTIADQIAQSASGNGLIATAGRFTAASGGTGASGDALGITSSSTPLPVTIPIYIGDEVVRVVRTEIDSTNRDVRRTVRAGAGVTAG